MQRAQLEPRATPGGTYCPCYDLSRAADNDHALGRCMWRKPAEITRGRYRDDRFEIAVQLDDYASGQQMTPAMALESWLRSSAHRAVLANRGPWSHEAWQAMGVAVSQHYAVAWFGRSPDDGKARSRASQPASSSSPATRSARTQVTIRDASGRAFRTTAGE